MSKSEQQQEKKSLRRKQIVDSAFQIFVERKIEPVSMGEIAAAAGIGRATLFRYYNSKMELVIDVCAVKWKAYLDELDARRPLSSIGEIPALDRFIFTLDSYIGMYQNYKELLLYNDNFNHYVTYEGVEPEKLNDFYASLYSVNTRLDWMYEKAKEDRTFRTDIPKDEFMRTTVHTMMAACTYYAGGFIWGSEENKDYTPELKRIKEMIIDYATQPVR